MSPANCSKAEQQPLARDRIQLMEFSVQDGKQSDVLKCIQNRLDALFSVIMIGDLP